MSILIKYLDLLLFRFSVDQIIIQSIFPNNKLSISMSRPNPIIQEDEHQHHAQNDSIQLNDNTDVHQYNLDSSYDDIQKIESSSDQEQKQITHQEFIRMINTQERLKNSNSNTRNFRSQSRGFEDTHQSNLFKRSNNHQRYINSTKDQTFLQSKANLNQRQNISKHQDPELESYQKKNQLNTNKVGSFFNRTNLGHMVKEFDVDSFAKTGNQKKQKSKKNKKQQDLSFTLITLPELDESSSNSSYVQNPYKRRNDKIKNKKWAQVYNRNKQQDDSGMGWRYQQAKLKFIDNFMPESMKISSNPYNMLKYINNKNEITAKIMGIVQ